MPGDSAGRATDTRYQRLYSHTSNTYSAVQRVLVHILWCCFAAGVDAVMLRSEEKVRQKKKNGLELNQLYINVLVEISEF